MNIVYCIDSTKSTVNNAQKGKKREKLPLFLIKKER
ncbi:hypothetical protein CLOL250_00036 [Clostridium sp. L2-50]|nr:hypothetical protein CLOL250_00036 [Clostridium sp. L2-50]